MHILIGKTGVLRLSNLPGKSLVLALVVGWAATVIGQAQDIYVKSEKYTLHGYESRLDSLRKVNGASLCCYEPQIELAALLALGHYPELRNIKIKVVYKNRLSAPIKASPVLWGMFRSRKKRWLGGHRKSCVGFAASHSGGSFATRNFCTRKLLESAT